MNPKALIVEDDDRIIESIEDALFSIGHEHDWATNQHDARKLLRDNDYSYVLLDLQIPAKPNRGSASEEFSCNLLRDIQLLKGKGRTPVIVMAASNENCLDLTTELVAGGASDFIAKPFSTKGRTLAKVIRKVLSENERKQSPAPADADSSRADNSNRFTGGELAFFPDRAELCGVKVITDMGAGQSLKLLNELRRKDYRGRYVRLSAEELATAIGAVGGVGTITGCVRAIRRNVISRFKKHLGVRCEADDLIRNDEQGYYLRDWITIREIRASIGNSLGKAGTSADTEDGSGDIVHDCSEAAGDNISREGNSSLNERQEWLLAELRSGAKLQRVALERRFAIHARTAKRDFADLNRRGLIEFLGDGRDGYYRLRRKHNLQPSTSA